VLIWDVESLLRRPTVKPILVPERELQALWRHLSGEDAERAYRALWRLAAAPEQAVPFLSERLRPVASPDAQQTKQIRQWVADLDSPRFVVRDAAMRELQGGGETAAPALREALAGAGGLEARRRLESLLAKLDSAAPTGEVLRALRAVEALEAIGTEGARRLLGQLAGGAPHARLTREARASLERLTRKGP
jgi:hypothetical protein